MAACALVGVILRRTVLAPAPIIVRVASVQRGRVEHSITNSRAGTVKARRRAKLSPEEGGRIALIAKRKGDTVTKGELLLRLDTSVQQARVDLARHERQSAAAEQTRACVTAARAGRELGRQRRLSAQGLIATDALDGFESAARSSAAACTAAGANLQRADSAIALAERQLEHTELRAPFDGIIANLAIEVGEWTTPSPPGVLVPSVLDIIDPSSIYISAPMDEVDSARVRVALPARVSIDSYPDQHFEGRVMRVAAFVQDVEEQNRTVEIEVELTDATFAATLLPGTSADVEVVLATHDNTLRVPTAAVLAGSKVLLVDGDTLAERMVELGLKNWDFTEIAHGLAADDRVVLSLDRPEVKAGARVQIEPDAPR